jgi:hypothetical protein
MHQSVESTHGLRRPLVSDLPEAPHVRRPLRRDPPKPPPSIPVTDDPLRRNLAEEIEFVQRQVEALGEELAGDHVVLMRHMVSMQTLDRVAQILGHLAAVSRSSDPVASVDRIGMVELKARLQRRPLYPTSP